MEKRRNPETDLDQGCSPFGRHEASAVWGGLCGVDEAERGNGEPGSQWNFPALRLI